MQHSDTEQTESTWTDLVKLFSVEERLRGLTADERLRGLSAEEIIKELRKRQFTEKQKNSLRKLLDRNRGSRDEPN